MRIKQEQQLSLLHIFGKGDIPKELHLISLILDANPKVLDSVFSDLTNGCSIDTGALGMTAEQVLRVAVLKQYRQMDYRELAFHLSDSDAFRAFARLGMGQYPAFQTLQDNVIKISDSSWEIINEIIVQDAAATGVETGRKVRFDATAIECAILEPCDSSLLRDGVRIITRWLLMGKRFTLPETYTNPDHRRVMKKRFTLILNSKKDEIKVAAYKDQIKYAHLVHGYAETALPLIEKAICKTPEERVALDKLVAKIKNAQTLLLGVINQTERRVIKKETAQSGRKSHRFFNLTQISLSKRTVRPPSVIK